MALKRIPLTPGDTFHIYNQTVGWDHFFITDENYRFFLTRVQKWLVPIADIFAYTLIPDSFDIVLKIKNSKDLLKILAKKIKVSRAAKKYAGMNLHEKEQLILGDLIIQQFSHCFNSYAQAFNKAYKRKGSLFRQSFKRRKIDSPERVIESICYVHSIPLNENFAVNVGIWKHSSFNVLAGKMESFLKRDKVLELFQGTDNFILLHKKFVDDTFR